MGGLLTHVLAATSHAYLPKLHAAAADDGELAVSMIRVIGLKDRPEGLVRPDRMLRVLRGNLRRPAQPSQLTKTTEILSK